MPIVPAITDHEIPSILEAAAAAGAQTAGFTVMRLPGAVAGLFEAWLDRHFPDRKEKVLHRIRDLRRRDEFSFSSSQETATPAQQFSHLLREGPALGMHTIAWCDTAISVDRTIDRGSLRGGRYSNARRELLFRYSAMSAAVTEPYN